MVQSPSKTGTILTRPASHFGLSTVDTPCTSVRPELEEGTLFRTRILFNLYTCNGQNKAQQQKSYRGTRTMFFLLLFLTTDKSQVVTTLHPFPSFFFKQAFANSKCIAATAPQHEGNLRELMPYHVESKTRSTLTSPTIKQKFMRTVSTRRNATGQERDVSAKMLSILPNACS